MEYKASYTKKELKELLLWFETRKDKLPKSFEYNKYTKMPDFSITVSSIIDILNEVDGERVAFSGQLTMFFNIREKLVAQGY